MHLLVDKPKQVIISLHKVHNSVALDEQIDDVRKVSYLLSFLLLESEEDCIVKIITKITDRSCGRAASTDEVTLKPVA